MNVEEINIENAKCLGKDDRLDLSRYVNLRNVTVGTYCYYFQEVFNFTGLNTLESVVIGENSFTKRYNTGGYDPNRHFYLKDCENLKELKFGLYAFSDFAVCEIENLPSLEVIEIGELGFWSYNFWNASLELKSDDDRMKMMTRLTEVGIDSDWS